MWSYYLLSDLLTFVVRGHHHHHHVMPQARISLALSRYFSQSFIASGKSPELHPVSSHSCCMHVRAGRPAFARPYVGSIGVHHLWARPCFSSSILHVWFVWLGWFSWREAGDRIVGAMWGVAARIFSILFATVWCNCRLASSPAI